MKASELIGELQKLPSDAEIGVAVEICYDNYYYNIVGVNTETKYLDLKYEGCLAFEEVEGIYDDPMYDDEDYKQLNNYESE